MVWVQIQSWCRFECVAAQAFNPELLSTSPIGTLVLTTQIYADFCVDLHQLISLHRLITLLPNGYTPDFTVSNPADLYQITHLHLDLSRAEPE
jgi:hypothetical protein